MSNNKTHKRRAFARFFFMPPQGKYWILTDFNTDINYDTEVDAFWKSKNIVFSTGQLEKCPVTEKLHWQFVVCYEKKVRLRTVKTTLGNGVHAELSDSAAANQYCTKENTSQGRRWEWGSLPVKRNSAKDWDAIWDRAKGGDFESIPAQIRVTHYNGLRRIAMDHMKAEGIEKEINVFWGPTGSGKSKRAWEEAGLDAYPKAPTTKFWDGYQGQEHVVIDEFFGQIEISHMLRWLDRYPVLVETKGSGTSLKAKKIWITSNLHPSEWYRTAPEVQVEALLRRLNIFEIN